MPNSEFIKEKMTRHNVVSLSGHLRVFSIFACPICGRYTIHEPRLNPKGNWYVDHKRVPVHQIAFDGSRKFMGLMPEEACFVKDNNDIANMTIARTVIRVK